MQPPTLINMVSPCTGGDTVVEHADFVEITGKEEEIAHKNFRYASGQIINQ